MATKPAEINTGENVRYAVEGALWLLVPNGLDHHDTSILLGVLNALDRSGAEFNGTADIPSQDRTIKVRIWHDTEVHRLEVIES